MTLLSAKAILMDRPKFLVQESLPICWLFLGIVCIIGSGHDFLQGIFFQANIYHAFWKLHIFYSVAILTALALLVCSIFITFLLERTHVTPATCILSVLITKSVIRFLYNDDEYIFVTVVVIMDAVLLSVIIASLTQLTFQFYEYRLHGLFPKS